MVNIRFFNLIDRINQYFRPYFDGCPCPAQPEEAVPSKSLFCNCRYLIPKMWY